MLLKKELLRQVLPANLPILMKIYPAGGRQLEKRLALKV
jgi:hypothetical protein